MGVSAEKSGGPEPSRVERVPCSALKEVVVELSMPVAPAPVVEGRAEAVVEAEFPPPQAARRTALAITSMLRATLTESLFTKEPLI